MRTITKDNKTVALIFDGKYQNGTNGVTDTKLPLQVISLKHPKGKFWPAHTHTPKRRITNSLNEVFFVTKGSAKIEIVINKKIFKSFVLKAGQGVMVLIGAIQIKALSDLTALEFKNGPFIEDKKLV